MGSWHTKREPHVWVWYYETSRPYAPCKQAWVALVYAGTPVTNNSRATKKRTHALLPNGRYLGIGYVCFFTEEAADRARLAAVARDRARRTKGVRPAACL